MAGLAAVDELDRRAYRRLPIKNTLSATDARLVDEAFQAKLTAVGDPDEDGIEAPHSSPVSGHPVLPQGQQETQRSEEIISYGIDKSLLTIPEPRRLRDKIYLRFVAKQPCLICGSQPCDAHHLRFAQSRGLGLKVSDEFTVPLCRGHHREVHRAGLEKKWWSTVGIDATGVARKLWIETHPLRPSPSRFAEDAPAALTTAAINATEGVRRRARKPRLTKRTQISGLQT